MGKIALKHYILLCGFLNLFFVNTVFSQGVTEIKIQNADSITSSKHIARGAERLKGNVKIIINEAVLTCDSAYYYQKEKMVDAFSHVHVNRGDTLLLWGDYMQYNQADSMVKVRKDVVLVNKNAKLLTQTLNYNMVSDVGYYPSVGYIFSDENELVSKKGAFYTDIDLALFHDSVVIHTPDYTIYSDSLKYDTENKIAYFLDSTHIINEENHIKCERGWYNTSEKEFVINKNAYLKNKAKTLTADSIYYNENTEFGIARSDVVITDSTRDAVLKGNYAEFLKVPEKVFITDSALMIQVMEGDSLFLHADTLRMTKDTSDNRIVKAYYNVKYFKSNIQGMCDSMFYSNNDSVIEFHGLPVIWSGENQITANYMEIFMKNKRMDHMNMVGLAFLTSEEDTSKYNQVKGKEMIGYFKDNEIYLIDVNGNGQSVYFLKDGEDYMGVNVSICSNLQIYLRQRKPFIIKNQVNPDAVLYPVSQAPQSKLKLENFNWLGEEKPKNKFDIFN